MKETILNYVLELEKTTNLNMIPTKLSSWIKSKSNICIYETLMNDNDNFGDNFLQRIFNIRYNIKEFPKCKVCGNKVNKFISYSKGYKDTCSIKCTNILKFGCEHPMRCNDVKEKLKTSLIEKYGVDNVFKSDVIKEKIKQTNLERYDVENPQQNDKIKEKTFKTNVERYDSISPLGNKEIRQKIKQTNLERYGTETPLENEEIRQKIKQTNLEKYGVETPMENESCKNNFKKSIFEKYGVDNLLMVPEILEKIKQTNLEKYGNEIYSKSRYFLDISFNNFKNLIVNYVTPLFNKDEYEGFSSEKIYEWKCSKCGNVFKQKLYTSSPYELNAISEYIPRCLKCFPRVSGTSYLEQDFLKFIKSIYNGNIIENDRKLISPLELDAVIPEKKIAFEFNGIYWHSDKIKNNNKYYHLNKTLKCEEIGHKLIHIWEYDWINPNKQNILKEKIKALLGVDQTKIYARKCEIKEINSKIKNDFLNKHHIQGEDKSKIKLGLFHENELVAVMTFGKPRFNKNYEWELIRYATKSGYQILGGAGKLLSYFERNYNPKNIITYADRSYSQGNMYRQIGFENHSQTPPNYNWIKNSIIISRYQSQKHKLKKILCERFDENLSENENMLNNGYHKIFDCGNLIFCK